MLIALQDLLKERRKLPPPDVQRDYVLVERERGHSLSSPDDDGHFSRDDNSQLYPAATILPSGI